MIISRKSWHYRLQNKTFRSEAKTLCGYFWRVFFSPFILVAGVLAVAFLLALCLPYLIVFGPYQLILKNRKAKDKLFPKDFFMWLHVTAIVFVAALVSLTPCEYGEYFRANILISPLVYLFLSAHFMDIKDTMPEAQEEKKESSLVVEYIRAKKQKVCPLIDYVND